MLQHIALTVNDTDEVVRFYQEVLRFSVIRRFRVNSEIARQIFSTGEAVDVVLMERDESVLELFLSTEKEYRVFSHVCLAFQDAETIYSKAVDAGYTTVEKRNPGGNNTWFIRDGSGNLFEMKKLHQ